MLTPYYNENAGQISFTREQGSRFAKEIGDDFNPIHNEDAQRFCVPGDLLFAIILQKYGVSEKMRFTFDNMVTESVSLTLPDDSPNLSLSDGKKQYLSVDRTGAVSQCSTLINNIIKNYVAFSGATFPHIIVPLMAEKDVMINTLRPMVMYSSMSIALSNLNMQSPELICSDPVFEYQGKRGTITLPFKFVEQDQVIGSGEKNMMVSGIKPYDPEAMEVLITAYNNRSL